MSGLYLPRDHLQSCPFPPGQKMAGNKIQQLLLLLDSLQRCIGHFSLFFSFTILTELWTGIMFVLREKFFIQHKKRAYSVQGVCIQCSRCFLWNRIGSSGRKLDHFWPQNSLSSCINLNGCMLVLDGNDFQYLTVPCFPSLPPKEALAPWKPTQECAVRNFYGILLWVPVPPRHWMDPGKMGGGGISPGCNFKQSPPTQIEGYFPAARPVLL